MIDATPNTRYERVKEILDEAAGRSAVDYDGKGKFWDLPLSQLLEVEIYGVRMIAPARAATASCCHGDPADAAPEGRGARSGLIRGLRGQTPFDGTQFPRLPWGGQAVTEEEIGFISDWIDDGCPPDDHEVSFEAEGEPIETSRETVEPGNVEAAAMSFAVYEGSPNEYSYKYGELKQRMNVDCMSEPQIEKLRWAFRELYNLNKWPEDRRSYNNMALIHQNHCQHGWERFLPWHRIYIYEMEQALQDVCPGVTLPYWDFTMPRYCPENPAKGLRIPIAYKAYLNDDSIKYLEQTDSELAEVARNLRTKMGGSRYSSVSCFFDAVSDSEYSKYAAGKHRVNLIKALIKGNSLWYPLRYPGEYHNPNKPHETQEINTSIFHYHYPTAEDMEQIFALRTFRDFGGGSFYDDSFGFLDQNPHNTMHIWTGGQNPDYPPPDSESSDAQLTASTAGNRNRGVQVTGRRFHSMDDLISEPEFGDMLSNLTASYDPVFWPIHTNIDRVWHEWQQQNPHSTPQDLDAVLTPWSYTIHDTLDMSRFGYEYVKCAFVMPVGLATPVGRFVSNPIAVPDSVRSSFKHAEVRLHRVPQLPRSCFIRVFLNLPDANASTSIEDPHYAGYLAIFGHGDCIGGPGHCDLPPSRPRQYDQRPRHHNTPRNHRVNVTETAKRLLEHASALQITLVVIGADYCEENELLRLDGVSLNFLD